MAERPRPGEGRICVLANPRAGGWRGEEALAAALRELGPGAELRRWSRRRGLRETARRAVADGFETIVAAGGDGTVMATAQELIGTRVRLGVLPMGTFNYFARGLGLPQTPAEAARALRCGQEIRLAVATVNGHVFLNNASLGLYPFALRVREGVYRRWGRSRLAAHLSMVRALLRSHRPLRLRLRVDDGPELESRSPLVFVARSALQLETLGLPGAEAIRADRFAVFVLRAGGRLEMARMALRLAAGTVSEDPGLELFEAETLQLDLRRPRVQVAIDGERLRQLSAPLLCVPANHDLPHFDPVLRVLDGFGRFRAATHGPCAPSWASDRVAVAGMNTARIWRWTRGRITAAQVRALPARLGGLGGPGAMRLVALHHPLEPVDPGARAPALGAGRLLAQLPKLGVRVVLSGHEHVGRAQPLAAAPGVLSVQGGTALSTRRRGQANGFFCLDLADNAAPRGRPGALRLTWFAADAGTGAARFLPGPPVDWARDAAGTWRARRDQLPR